MNLQSLHPRSRQKSCKACAEDKRRCNRKTPQCSLCLSRGVQCVYIKGPSTRQGQGEARLEPIDPGFRGDFSDISSLSPPIESLLSNCLDTNPWLTVSPSLFPLPSLASAKSYPDIAFLDRWSVDQLVRNIKSYPRMFARFQETPFIHSRLYESHLPDAIQGGFTVSEASASKSTQTENMTFRILETKTTRLTQQDFETRSLEELLAAVQALMLFHIIQTFDSNIRQRSIAEQNFYTLQSWTIQLRVWAGDLPPALAWQEWIFAESVRRTVIFSTIIDGMYSC
jgi:hypothetical protein